METYPHAKCHHPHRSPPTTEKRYLRKESLGEEITLDSRLILHWLRGNKTQTDINTRLSALPLIEEVVKKNAEIWENPNGSRTYLASVVDPWRANGKSYTIAFTQSSDNTVLETYFPNSNNAEQKRQGKQLYPQKPTVAPGT